MRKEKFLIINMCVPIIIGAILYYFFAPDVVFVNIINKYIGKEIHLYITVQEFVILRILRNYLLDMFWAYSLVYVLFFILGNNTTDLIKIFIISIIFSIIMESLQITQWVEGTFDVVDILVECLSELAAVIIIKYKFSKGGRAVK